MTFLNGTNSSLKTHTTAAVYYVCKWNQNLQNEVILSHAFCSCRKPHNNNNFPLCSSVFKRLFFANCIISFLFPCLIQYFDLNTYDKTVRMIVSLFCIRLLVFNTYAVGSLELDQVFKHEYLQSLDFCHFLHQDTINNSVKSLRFF